MGEYLEFRFDYSVAGKVSFHGFDIVNGYAKSDDLCKKNARVRSFGVTLNGEEIGTVDLCISEIHLSGAH